MWRGIARTVLWIFVIGGCLASFIGGCMEPIFFLGIPIVFLISTGFGLFVELADNVAAIRRSLSSNAYYGNEQYSQLQYGQPVAPQQMPQNANGLSFYSFSDNSGANTPSKPARWTCRKCGNENANSIRYCVVCGETRHS